MGLNSHIRQMLAKSITKCYLGPASYKGSHLPRRRVDDTNTVSTAACHPALPRPFAGSSVLECTHDPAPGSYRSPHGQHDVGRVASAYVAARQSPEGEMESPVSENSTQEAWGKHEPCFLTRKEGRK